MIGERRKSTLISYGSHKDGRLSMVRKLSLSLEGGFMSRSIIEIQWGGFFSKQPGHHSWNIHFPVLEELVIDFTGLELRSEEDNWVRHCSSHIYNSIYIVPKADEIQLNAFVRKLETFGKLKKLTVRGVSHPKTLETLREKLVRDDGEFRRVVV